jgi:hypothetical protein
VSAVNDRGAGLPASSVPWGLAPLGLPAAPSAVTLLPLNASALTVQWDAALPLGSRGGQLPSAWLVESDSSSSFNGFLISDLIEEHFPEPEEELPS